MGVPAGRLDARAVAGLRGQAVERPRDPGGRGLHRLRQGLERSVVLGGGRQLLERGRVPRAAHDGDVGEAVLCRLADAAPHRGLALEGEASSSGTHRGRRSSPPRPPRTGRRDRVATRPGGPRSVRRPPRPRPWRARSGSWRTSSGSTASSSSSSSSASASPSADSAASAAAGFGHATLELRLGDRQLGTGREIDEPGRDPVLERPAQGDPLRAELRERVERGDARLIGA